MLYSSVIISPGGEDTKTAQPTCNTGKGNGQQVRNVNLFTFADDSKPTSQVNFSYELFLCFAEHKG